MKSGKNFMISIHIWLIVFVIFMCKTVDVTRDGVCFLVRLPACLCLFAELKLLSRIFIALVFASLYKCCLASIVAWELVFVFVTVGSYNCCKVKQVDVQIYGLLLISLFFRAKKKKKKKPSLTRSSLWWFSLQRSSWSSALPRFQMSILQFFFSSTLCKYF